MQRNDFIILWKGVEEEPLNEKISEESFGYQLIDRWSKKFKGQCTSFECVDGFPSFLVDFSKIPIKGMSMNLVAITKPPKDQAAKNRLCLYLNRYAEQTATLQSLCFVIFLHYEPFTEFTPNYFQTVGNSVGLFGKDLNAMFSSMLPEEIFTEIIKEQLPQKNLCPFNTSNPAVDRMFVGREQELTILTEQKYASVLLSGSRRIGKSSIMRKAEVRLKARISSGDRPIFINCITCKNYYDVVRKISSELEQDYEDVLRKGLNSSLRNYTNQGKDRLIFFFDEFDEVAIDEQLHQWKLLEQLNDAVTNKYIRVIFAGYREVRSIKSNNLSPFYESCKALTLSPLALKDVESLLLDPIIAYGINIENKELFLQSAFEKSGGLPFIIQYFGEKIWDYHIHLGVKQIGLDTLQEVYEHHDTYSFLMENFQINTQPIERAVAIIHANKSGENGMVVGEIIGVLSDYDIHLNDLAISYACENLIKANIFSFKRGKYFFIFPLYKDIILEAFPEKILDKFLNSIKDTKL